MKSCPIPLAYESSGTGNVVLHLAPALSFQDIIMLFHFGIGHRRATKL